MSSRKSNRSYSRESKQFDEALNYFSEIVKQYFDKLIHVDLMKRDNAIDLLLNKLQEQKLLIDYEDSKITKLMERLNLSKIEALRAMVIKCQYDKYVNDLKLTPDQAVKCFISKLFSPEDGLGSMMMNDINYKLNKRNKIGGKRAKTEKDIPRSTTKKSNNKDFKKDETKAPESKRRRVDTKLLPSPAPSIDTDKRGREELDDQGTSNSGLIVNRAQKRRSSAL
jgi:hypothetical protein